MLHVYSLSGKSNNWLNRTIRNIGEEPVIFDSTLVFRTENDFRKLLVNRGYITAEVSTDILRHDKKAEVRFTIRGNQPYRIRHYGIDSDRPELTTEVFGAAGEPELRIDGEAAALRTPAVREGMLFDRNRLDAERTRLTTLLKNRGYYAFTKDNITYDADSSLNANAVDLQLKMRVLADTANPFAGRKFYFDKISYYLDYDPLRRTALRQDSLVVDGHTVYYSGRKPSLKPSLLLNNTFLVPGRAYSELQEDRTYSAFSNLRALNNIHIQFSEKTRNDSSLLDVSLLAVPARKQAVSFSVEGTNTAGDLGVAVSANYAHRNLFRGSETFNFRVRGAYEALSNL
jgi:outer membrane protein assembly factor BamA